MVTANTCIRCGAPLSGNKCEYCGTVYGGRGFTGGFDAYKGTITVNGESIECYISDIEYETLVADCGRDISGRILHTPVSTKRKITLVEW